MAVETKGPDRLGVTIVEALGIDKDLVRRLIVDCQACRPPTIYIEGFDDEAIYDINWALLLQGAEVKFVKDLVSKKGD